MKFRYIVVFALAIFVGLAFGLTRVSNAQSDINRPECMAVAGDTGVTPALTQPASGDSDVYEIDDGSGSKKKDGSGSKKKCPLKKKKFKKNCEHKKCKKKHGNNGEDDSQ